MVVEVFRGPLRPFLEAFSIPVAAGLSHRTGDLFASWRRQVTTFSHVLSPRSYAHTVTYHSNVVNPIIDLIELALCHYKTRVSCNCSQETSLPVLQMCRIFLRNVGVSVLKRWRGRVQTHEFEAWKVRDGWDGMENPWKTHGKLGYSWGYSWGTKLNNSIPCLLNSWINPGRLWDPANAWVDTHMVPSWRIPKKWYSIEENRCWNGALQISLCPNSLGLAACHCSVAILEIKNDGRLDAKTLQYAWPPARANHNQTCDTLVAAKRQTKLVDSTATLCQLTYQTKCKKHGHMMRWNTVKPLNVVGWISVFGSSPKQSRCH